MKIKNFKACKELKSYYNVEVLIETLNKKVCRSSEYFR